MAGRPALRALPGFEADVHALPDPATKRMALEQLAMVRDGTIKGVPLEDHASTGDLTGCFKLYFDPDGSQKPRYRLVYRIVGDEVQAAAVEAVAVGVRRGLDVYFRAAKRVNA